MTRAHGKIADEQRQVMLDQTSRFLTWALAHPQFHIRIPRQRVGTGCFSSRVKRSFWGHAESEISRQLRQLHADHRF